MFNDPRLFSSSLHHWSYFAVPPTSLSLWVLGCVPYISIIGPMSLFHLPLYLNGSSFVFPLFQVLDLFHWSTYRLHSPYIKLSLFSTLTIPPYSVPMHSPAISVAVFLFPFHYSASSASVLLFNRSPSTRATCLI